MATLGSNPISSGASTVAPNIAITCWAPSAAVCGHGNLSSGATTTPGCAATSRHRGLKLIGTLLEDRFARRRQCRGAQARLGCGLSALDSAAKRGRKKDGERDRGSGGSLSSPQDCPLPFGRQPVRSCLVCGFSDGTGRKAVAACGCFA